MLEKPQLEEAKIIACLQEGFGLPVSRLDFLPIGNDATAWVYKVNGEDSCPYFLKIKKGVVYEPGLTIPYYLRDSGIEQVVAPFLSREGHLYKSVGDFTLTLYPFIAGSAGMQIGMTIHQWTQFGIALRAIHDTQLPAELLSQVRRENFAAQWGGVVKGLQISLQSCEYNNPLERELAAFWNQKHVEIAGIIDTTEALGRQLQTRSTEFVLCHTDIHTANVLIDTNGELFIVDWDNPLLAPKERDLMFVIGQKAQDIFFGGYGAAEVDLTALAYYRYEWVVQELGDYGKRVFLTPGIGLHTKRDAVQGFLQLFQPGDVVEAAYHSMYF